MTLRGFLKAYFTGWKNFLGSIAYVVPWCIIVGLPFKMVGCHGAEHTQGDASGAPTVHVLWAVLLLTWVPWMCYKLGMLTLGSDDRGARAREQEDQEIRLLRRIMASQERSTENGDEPEDAT